MIRGPERAVSTGAELLAVGALIGGFIAIVLWFDRVDFYHRHFFDAGAIVAADNAMRIVFVGIFAWLIYAPGAGIAALIMSPVERAISFSRIARTTIRPAGTSSGPRWTNSTGRSITSTRWRLATPSPRCGWWTSPVLNAG